MGNRFACLRDIRKSGVFDKLLFDEKETKTIYCRHPSSSSLLSSNEVVVQ
jgi:hypothetical protein